MRWLCLCVGLLSGCVDLGDDEPYPAIGIEGETGSFDAAQNAFTLSCATSGCHAGPFPAGDLSLEEGQSLEALFGPDGEGVPSGSCAGFPLVEPGAPDASCLWIRVREGEMPPGGNLPAPQRDAIRAWIEAGAPAAAE